MLNAKDLIALPTLADALGLSLSDAEITGSLGTWRGPYAIDDIAVSSVISATAAAAELLAERNQTRLASISIDAQHGAASFLTDALVEPEGWQLPPVWDPIAGDYATSDGWIRLHTNYAHHRAAALRALGVNPTATIDRQAIAALVAQWCGDELELAVVANNGAAAYQRREAEWHTLAAGIAVESEPLLEVDIDPIRIRSEALRATTLPFDGVRVLDLTRVLAGPIATGFLAAWGADVLRIDPPGFEEVAAIVPITTCGKRTAAIDLASARGRGREQFLALLQTADVLVHAYRPGALHNLGLDHEQLQSHRPGLVVASLCAYGWTGPWSTRRGFDSLVQHSTGITAYAQAQAGSKAPIALPCQALDNGCGWLLAAAVARGLTQRLRTGHGSTSRTSLARFSQFLRSIPATVDPDRPQPTFTDIQPHTATAATEWGPLRRLTWPGTIDSMRPRLGASHRLGAHAPAWSPQ